MVQDIFDPEFYFASYLHPVSKVSSSNFQTKFGRSLKVGNTETPWIYKMESYQWMGQTLNWQIEHLCIVFPSLPLLLGMLIIL